MLSARNRIATSAARVAACESTTSSAAAFVATLNGSRRMSSSASEHSSGKVNPPVYRPGGPYFPEVYASGAAAAPTSAAATSFSAYDLSTKRADEILGRHENSGTTVAGHGGKWDQPRIRRAIDENSLFTWGAGSPMSDGAIHISHGDGVYFHDVNGKKFIDFNSMAMCTHLGHTAPTEIRDAINDQLRTLPYCYPGMFVAPIRAKLCELLADVFPGDIDSFMFPSSGAEANEAALRIARLYTGRRKVFARYRSYHGGTLGAMAVTGDYRRFPTDAFTSGVVHTFDPFPYSFSLGGSPAEVTGRALQMLEEHLFYEGPKNVAAIILESITGTNGVLVPPPGYLAGVRRICDRHGILLICDEVMAGFGRTGKLFGFCHSTDVDAHGKPTDQVVIPDIVTFAKGVNSAVLPLGGVGVRRHIAEHFRRNAIGYGSTYNAHPVSLASAYATIQYMLKHRVVDHVAEMESVMRTSLEQLAQRHPSVKQARNVGLFSAIDFQRNARGDFVASVNDPLPPAMLEFKKRLLAGGLFTMMRGHTMFCNPPLIITPAQIQEGFKIIDDALVVLDEAMEK